jgi:hypothetical protein
LNSNQQVNIAWIVETETENAGYNLLRNEVRQLVTAQKINDGLIDAGSEFGTQIQYSYTDMEVDEGATFFYWLESVSLNGESEFFGPITVAVSGEGSSPEIPNLPLITELYSAFPNPFNPATNLLYSLKEDGLVRLEIYNQKGQKVKSFDSYHDKAGVYKQAWDGRDWQGNPVASGVYFYKLICGSYSATKKMILLK